MSAPAWQPMRLNECARCGFTFGHPDEGNSSRGPRLCQSCRLTPAPRHAHGINPGTAGYRLALAATELRLAVEQARAALRMGRPDVALAVLEHHEPPGQEPRP